MITIIQSNKYNCTPQHNSKAVGKFYSIGVPHWLVIMKCHLNGQFISKEEEEEEQQQQQQQQQQQHQQQHQKQK
eukprot:10997617-Ditylum_brightwellii.AAC.1